MKKNIKVLKYIIIVMIMMFSFNTSISAKTEQECINEKFNNCNKECNNNILYPTQTDKNKCNSKCKKAYDEKEYDSSCLDKKQSQDANGSAMDAQLGSSNQTTTKPNSSSKPSTSDDSKEKITDNSEEKDNNDSVNTNDDMGDLDYERLCNLEIIDDIKNVWKMICIIAPILVVLLGSIDYAQAVISQDEQQMKKSVSKFTKRLIIGVALFFLPYLVRLIFAIANDAGLDKVINDVLCGI